MSNSNEPTNKELAERLWNQQGRPEDHARGDWLESEYRAHPPITPVQNEADLRMRGLGPLTRGDATEQPKPTQPSKSKTLATGSLVIVAAVCVGIGALYSFLRRFSA